MGLFRRPSVPSFMEEVSLIPACALFHDLFLNSHVVPAFDYKEMYWIKSFVNMLVGILCLLEYLDEKLCQNTLQYLQKL